MVKSSNNSRQDGRAVDQIRSVILNFDLLGYADASVLLEFGQTKVLVSVSLQPTVPPFLKGQKLGWLTAEYAMLPCATLKRTVRESSQVNRNSRSIEISRFIGRNLRAVSDLSGLGERTIMVDCDVLQADGGTRVASLTAASLALLIAQSRWQKNGIIEKNFLKEQIAAISVGLINGEFMTDLSYLEDSQADADFNFVFTQSGKIVEIQGTAEKNPLDWQAFETCKDMALSGINKIFKICEKHLVNNLDISEKYFETNNTKKFGENNSASLFSLASRLKI